MIGDTRRIELAKWVFERMLGWIGTADVKIGVALALDTAMIGGLAAAFGASNAAERNTWCYITTFLGASGLIAGMFCAAMAAIPRLLGPLKSSIFFARVADKTQEDYAAEFRAASEDDILGDLIAQIHRNAQIATTKHWWVRRSLQCTSFAALPCIVAIALLVKY